MKRILIVDDEPDILEVLKSSLERQKDLSVDVACDGEEALKKLGPEAPDLIILDLALPKMTGEELLKLIRNNFKTSDTPIVISTVARQVSSLINLLNLGATDYLIKPYDIKELTETIHRYV